MEGETIQWPKDNKGVIRSCKWKERQYNSFHLQLLITPLVSFDHWIVSPSIYSFRLQLWYLLVIVLSLLPFTASDYSFGIFWSLYCLSFHLQLLITHLVSFGHCIVSPSIYSFWLQLWYLLVIVLSLLAFTASDYISGIFWLLYCLLPFTVSDYTFGIFWSLYCLSFHLRLLITPLLLQLPKDTKGVIRNCKWKERQYNDQKITKV
jgi:hypothetical protein